MATLLDNAVGEVLASERSVLAFEAELSAIFDVSLDEVTDVLRAFFQRYAKNGKVSFSLLRKYLSSYEWGTFSEVLKEWQQDAAASPPRLSAEFAADISKLLKRKNVTALEELNFRVRHSIDRRMVKQMAMVAGLISINVIAAYYTKLFDSARHSTTGIPIVGMTKDTLDRIVNANWDDSMRYTNFAGRIQNNADRLIAEYELACKQAMAASQSSSAVEKILAARMAVAKNRDRALTRTEVSRAVNAADIAAYQAATIEKYKYVAVLDEVTTQICWSLHGSIFRVSQAQEQVNLPPMHTNCRSTTEPVIEDMEGDNLVSVSRTESLESFIEKNYEGEYLDEVLDFIQDYRK